MIQKKRIRDTTDREWTVFCDDQNLEKNPNCDNFISFFWLLFGPFSCRFSKPRFPNYEGFVWGGKRISEFMKPDSTIQFAETVFLIIRKKKFLLIINVSIFEIFLEKSTFFQTLGWYLCFMWKFGKMKISPQNWLKTRKKTQNKRVYPITFDENHPFFKVLDNIEPFLDPFFSSLG